MPSLSSIDRQNSLFHLARSLKESWSDVNLPSSRSNDKRGLHIQPNSNANERLPSLLRCKDRYFFSIYQRYAPDLMFFGGYEGYSKDIIIYDIR